MIVGRDAKPSLETLVHFGVKGMHWGVRRDRSPAMERSRQRAKAERKLNRIDTNRVIEGYSNRGYYQTKHVERLVAKNPTFKFSKLSKTEQQALKDKASRKAIRGNLLRGATEVAVILATSNIVLNRMQLSPQTRRGGKISFAILAGKAAQIRIHDINNVRIASKFDRLQTQISDLSKKT